MIVKLAEGFIKTKFGEFNETLFYDGQKESHVLVMGTIENEEDVLCRVHSLCIFGHHFNSIECDCREQMEISQQLIQKAGKGIVVWLNQEGKGNGHYALMKSIEHKKKGVPQAEAYEAVGFKKDARDFTVAAEILQELKVKSVRMLTNNPNKVETLTKHGIIVTGIQKTEL
jgi:GTP cyclohydrolase II